MTKELAEKWFGTERVNAENLVQLDLARVGPVSGPLQSRRPLCKSGS